MGTVSLVQRPTIVSLNKRPGLLRQLEGQRIRLDVTNSPSHFVGMIEKDFPAPTAPGRVIFRPSRYRRQMGATLFLQSVHHLFREVLVFADQNMHVVWHDDTGRAGVTILLDNRCKCLRDMGADDSIE